MRKSTHRLFLVLRGLHHHRHTRSSFTVPSALKAWIDRVVRVRWTFNISPEGKIRMIRDRPLFIAFSSGGRSSGEHARQPDFVTPYLRAVFDMIGTRLL
jgi:FMN-dependent NADH-azoreductase